MRCSLDYVITIDKSVGTAYIVSTHLGYHNHLARRSRDIRRISAVHLYCFQYNALLCITKKSVASACSAMCRYFFNSFLTVLTNKLYHKIELKSIFNSTQISNKRL